MHSVNSIAVCLLANYAHFMCGKCHYFVVTIPLYHIMMWLFVIDGSDGDGQRWNLRIPPISYFKIAILQRTRMCILWDILFTSCQFRLLCALFPMKIVHILKRTATETVIWIEWPWTNPTPRHNSPVIIMRYCYIVILFLCFSSPRCCWCWWLFQRYMMRQQLLRITTVSMEIGEWMHVIQEEQNGREGKKTEQLKEK